MNFCYFVRKINQSKISWLKTKLDVCLNWFLVSASRILIRLLKFWFAGSGSDLKWTGTACLLCDNGLPTYCTLSRGWGGRGRGGGRGGWGCAWGWGIRSGEWHSGRGEVLYNLCWGVPPCLGSGSAWICIQFRCLDPISSLEKLCLFWNKICISSQNEGNFCICKIKYRFKKCAFPISPYYKFYFLTRIRIRISIPENRRFRIRLKHSWIRNTAVLASS